MLDKGAVSYLAAAGSVEPPTIILSFYVMRGLLRVCIAFGFIAYLGLWRYTINRTTSMLSLFKLVVFPFVTAVIPLIAIFRRSNVAILPGIFLMDVMIPLMILMAVIALSDRVFRELRIGTNNMRHRLSRAYLSLLVAKVPPTARSDLWLLDCVMVIAVIAIALVPIR